jgi:hypothetical protein
MRLCQYHSLSSKPESAAGPSDLGIWLQDNAVVHVQILFNPALCSKRVVHMQIHLTFISCSMQVNVAARVAAIAPGKVDTLAAFEGVYTTHYVSKLEGATSKNGPLIAIKVTGGISPAQVPGFSSQDIFDLCRMHLSSRTYQMSSTCRRISIHLPRYIPEGYDFLSGGQPKKVYRAVYKALVWSGHYTQGCLLQVTQP